MVNRIIPYLGRMPHVLHRLDMFTSGYAASSRLFLAPACITALTKLSFQWSSLAELWMTHCP